MSAILNYVEDDESAPEYYPRQIVYIRPRYLPYPRSANPAPARVESIMSGAFGWLYAVRIIGAGPFAGEVLGFPETALRLTRDLRRPDQ